MLKQFAVFQILNVTCVLIQFHFKWQTFVFREQHLTSLTIPFCVTLKPLAVIETHNFGDINEQTIILN